MSIPLNPPPPNLPLAPAEWSRMYQDQFSNVLRLYFKNLNSTVEDTLVQVSSNQTLIWLNM
jgi:hypothetical protein